MKYKSKYSNLKQIGSAQVKPIWCKCGLCRQTDNIDQPNKIKSFEELKNHISENNLKLMPDLNVVNRYVSDENKRTLKILEENKVRMIHGHGATCSINRFSVKEGYQFITSVKIGEIHKSNTHSLLRQFFESSSISLVKIINRDDLTRLSDFFNIYKENDEFNPSTISHHVHNENDTINNQKISLIAGYNSEKDNYNSELKMHYIGIIPPHIYLLNQQHNIANRYLKSQDEFSEENRVFISRDTLHKSDAIPSECFYKLLRDGDLSVNHELRKAVIYKYYIEFMLHQSLHLKKLLFYVNNKIKKKIKTYIENNQDKKTNNSKFYTIKLKELHDNFLDRGIFILESCRTLSANLESRMKSLDSLRTQSVNIKSNYTNTEINNRVCESPRIPSLKLANTLAGSKNFICSNEDNIPCYCCPNLEGEKKCRCLSPVENEIYTSQKLFYPENNLDICQLSKEDIIILYFDSNGIRVGDRENQKILLKKLLNHPNLVINHTETVKLYDYLDNLPDIELGVNINLKDLRNLFLSKLGFPDNQINKLIKKNKKLIDDNNNLKVKNEILKLLNNNIRFNSSRGTSFLKLPIPGTYSKEQLIKIIKDQFPNLTVSDENILVKIIKNRKWDNFNFSEQPLLELVNNKVRIDVTNS